MIKKTMAAAVAAIMLLSGCSLQVSAPEDAGSGNQGTEAIQTESITEIAVPQQTEETLMQGGVSGNPGEDEPASVIAQTQKIKPIICDEVPAFADEIPQDKIYDYQTYSPIAQDIISKLTSHDSAGLSTLFGESTGHGFDFISDIDFNGTTITEETVTDGSFYLAKIKLIADGGDGRVFPQGENDWLLRIFYGASGPVAYFGPADTYYDGWVGRASIYEFCFYTSFHLGAFESMDDMSQIGTRDNLTDPNFYFSLVRTLWYANGENVPEGIYDELCKRSILLDNAKSLLNLSDLDPSVCGDFYDSTTEMISFPARGGTWAFWRPIKHETENNIHTITMDYYADESYLLVAKTMVYTIEELADGRYRMVSVEKIYDNESLEIAMASV